MTTPLPPLRADRCETCRYFLANRDPEALEANIGTCRRYPPLPADGRQQGGGGRWPRVHGRFGWCGESSCAHRNMDRIEGHATLCPDCGRHFHTPVEPGSHLDGRP